MLNNFWRWSFGRRLETKNSSQSKMNFSNINPMHIPKIDGPPKSVANLLYTTLAPPRLIQQQHNWDQIIFEIVLTIIIKSRCYNGLPFSKTSTNSVLIYVLLWMSTVHTPLLPAIDLKPLLIINLGFFWRIALFSTQIACYINRIWL